MKSTSLLSVIIVGLITTTSCKRNFTCTCYGGFTGIPGSTTIVAENKKTAREECEKNNPPQLPANYYCELD